MTCCAPDRQERKAGGHLPSRDVTEEQEPEGKDRGRDSEAGGTQNPSLQKKPGSRGKEV